MIEALGEAELAASGGGTVPKACENCRSRRVQTEILPGNGSFPTALTVGLAAGVLPARHAAHMEPVDALRAE